jgi:hypothetical protein
MERGGDNLRILYEVCKKFNLKMASEIEPSEKALGKRKKYLLESKGKTVK